ncbi:hypothetical protein BHE90_014637 [Fusarium euwallaceae]|uniref:Major facilitator superfamily (MFS) profile domain-containing protein n=2 Tax=Fusarium solani species complex TaxID=232080 RepID=A0A430L5M8_9HYPO|nr:hypothetical protein CEP51_011653 [Fusarium floridanum]RTE70965.1 hypothetical protein BHE90_014637 [Fusarium euwallaceae]
MGVVTILAFFFLEETGYNRDDGTFGDSGPPLHEPKTYVKRLKLVSDLKLPQSLGATIIQPIQLLVEPIILWCACLYGFGIAWLSIMAFTSNTVFQSPLYGYNFSFTAVGLTSLSPLVGSMILFYVGGAGTGRFMIWQARRNGGIMEPESRIYAALVAGPIMSAGRVLAGEGSTAMITVRNIIACGLFPNFGDQSLSQGASYHELCPVLTAGMSTASLIQGWAKIRAMLLLMQFLRKLEQGTRGFR